MNTTLFLQDIPMATTEFLTILGFVFIALSWGWNIVQAYVFVVDKFRPPEEREQFDAEKSLMLQELYRDMVSRHADDEYNAESGTILRRIESSVDSLCTMHNVTDENGIKMWYTPRGMVRNVDKILRILQETRSRYRNTAHHLESSSTGSLV